MNQAPDSPNSRPGTRVALVTGGTRGIGAGIARRLAAEGFDLALCGRREEADVAAILEELRGMGVDVLYWRCDVSDQAARERMLTDMRARFGRLHLLVNNAGVAPAERKDLIEASEVSFEQVMKVNLQGPYFLTQSVAKWMVAQKERDAGYQGCIVNISSVSASMASPNRGEYCLSKAGLSMATRLWAVRLAEFGIPVYEVRPGLIATDMTAGVKAKYNHLIAEGLVPQGRWGTPEEVGKAVAMLARGELPYSTGQVIMVDGGLTMEHL